MFNKLKNFFCKYWWIVIVLLIIGGLVVLCILYPMILHACWDLFLRLFVLNVGYTILKFIPSSLIQGLSNLALIPVSIYLIYEFCTTLSYSWWVNIIAIIIAWGLNCVIWKIIDVLIIEWFRKHPYL